MIAPSSIPASSDSPQVVELKRELQRAYLKIQVLELRLRLQRIQKYGPASEKLNDVQLERKRQSNTTLDAGGGWGYWFRAAQAAGVTSASRWMEMSARPGNTAPR